MSTSDLASASIKTIRSGTSESPAELSVPHTTNYRVRTEAHLLSTKELSRIWSIPESTLRYWRCAGLGPAYVKLGGRIKYDLADVEAYVRANKRKPSMRANGG